jgi:hypothetical protein
MCRNSDKLRAGRPRGRSSSPGRVKNFLFSKSSRPALRSTQPPIIWVPGALSPGVKRPGRVVDHSPQTSAEVKKMWIYTSTSIRLHGVVLNLLWRPITMAARSKVAFQTDVRVCISDKLVQRSWALLEEPPIVQPLKNFPAFYGTRRFNTVFIRALHWSLPWAISVQSTPFYPISKIHFNIVHTPTSWSSLWSLSSWLSNQYPIFIPLVPHSCYMPRTSHPSWLDHSNYIWRRVQFLDTVSWKKVVRSCIKLDCNPRIHVAESSRSFDHVFTAACPQFIVRT